jgi:hypothetical protein
MVGARENLMMKSLPHRRSRIGATSVVAALAVAAAAFAAGSAFAADGHAHAKPAAAAQPAHDHGAGHGHDHAVDRLALDDGRKWPTDAALRDGMSRLRALTAKRIDAAHHGKLSTVQYAALARRVETEVGGIVANCKLEPRADAMLHLVIAELGAGADAMAGKAPGVKRVQGLLKVASAVNAYGEHFDHPGFEPIAELQH